MSMMLSFLPLIWKTGGDPVHKCRRSCRSHNIRFSLIHKSISSTCRNTLLSLCCSSTRRPCTVSYFPKRTCSSPVLTFPPFKSGKVEVELLVNIQKRSREQFVPLQLMGIWALVLWQQMGQPKEVNLVELGPGRGALMADLLRVSPIPPALVSCSIHDRYRRPWWDSSDRK